MRTKMQMLAVIVLAAILVACGGGGSSNDNSNANNGSGSQQTTLQQAEAAASASIMGLVQFVAILISTPNSIADTQQPVNVDAVTPQTSESATPLQVQ